MDFKIQDIEADILYTALGIPEDRAKEMEHKFSDFLKRYQPVKVQPNGELVSCVNINEILVGFMNVAEEGSLPEQLFAAFHTGGHAEKLRQANHPQIPDFMRRIFDQMQQGGMGIIQIGPRKKKKKKPDNPDENIQEF